MIICRSNQNCLPFQEGDEPSSDQEAKTSSNQRPDVYKKIDAIYRKGDQEQSKLVREST